MRNLILFFLLLFLFSCKKKDSNPPSIEVYQPTKNATLNAGETISIKGKATDDIKIETIKIWLKDESGKIIGNSKTLHSDQNEFEFETGFEISALTPSGKYYFQIKANDGTNDKSEFVYVYVNEVPLTAEHIWLASNTGNQTNLYDFTSGSPVYKTSFSGDFIGSSFISSNNLYINCGEHYGNLTAYNTLLNSNDWEVQCIQNPTFPYFTSISKSTEDKFLVSYYNEQIKVYDAQGTLQRTIQNTPGYYSEIAFLNEENNVLICLEKPKSTGNNLLSVYYYSSGAIANQMTVNSNIKGFAKNSSKIFAFGNETNSIKKYSYQFNDKQIQLEQTINSDSIFFSFNRANEATYFAQKNGLYTFINSTGTKSYISNKTYSYFTLDEVNDVLYGIRSDSIFSFNLSSKTESFHYFNGNKWKSIEMEYNK
jgi:hypothetical protein